MNIVSFEFSSARLAALASGALWWPDRGVLVVSDLHLGKSERIARLGGALLPPYEAEETLSRLGDDIARCAPAVVVSLGDSFDDVQAGEALASGVRDRIKALQAGRRWIWIAGNHDPAPMDLGGDHLAELALAPLTFRHEAAPNPVGEVSGHYHPKARLALRGRGVSRPCFLLDGRRLILPAYGTFTGGLRSDDRVLCDLMQVGAEAILTGSHLARIPMPRGET